MIHLSMGRKVKTKTILLFVLLLILAACGGEKRGYSADKPVESNDQWKVVIQEFDGVEMVLVPVGCFEMGDTGEGGEQCIDEPFWIDRYEVTNDQYRRCVDTGACTIPTHTSANSAAVDYADPEYGDHPIVYINWFQANDYVAWRGEKYSLPTEAQWEYTVSGPDDLYFPWGNEFNGNYVVYSGNSPGTAPVGSKLEGVSWVGANDLSGNVWEWTSTLFQEYPYNATDGREDSEKGISSRVLRGGSFYYASDLLRAASRYEKFPNFWGPNMGFRAARIYEPGE
jgi:formylglycine-generating enzyme required for sulfatase activity